MTLWRFQIGEVFDPDDPLAVWVATLAVAFNDVVHANHRLKVDQRGWEFLYEWRVATGHYSEACLHMERGREISEVSAFIGGDERIVGLYDDALARYGALRAVTNRIRNQAAFHYAYATGADAVAHALRELSGERGYMGSIVSDKVKDSRQHYADEITSHLVWQASGGSIEAYEETAAALAGGVAAFARFAGATIERYFMPFVPVLDKVDLRTAADELPD